jgi:hypothetical protein
MKLSSFEEALGRKDLQNGADTSTMGDFRANLLGGYNPADAPGAGPPPGPAPSGDMGGPAPMPAGAPLSARLANNVGANAPPPPGAPMNQIIQNSPYAQTGAGRPNILAPGPAPMGTGNPNAPPPGAPAPLPSPAMRPPMGGGGGGFGALDKDVAADNRRIDADYEKQKQDTEALGAAQVDKTEKLATVQENEADHQRKMVEQQQAIEDGTQKRLTDWNAKTAQMMDEIKSDKVDPKRLYGNANAGTRLALIIGAGLSGWAAKGGENQFLKQMNANIDRDIHAQEQEHANKVGALNQRNSLYGQMLQQSGDQRLAALQTRQGLLESAKLQTQAQADRLGISEMQVRSRLAVGAIEGQMARNDKEVDVLKANVARSQAGAAYAAQQAREKMLHDREVEATKLSLEDRRVRVEEDKAAAEGKGGKELEARVEGYGKTLQGTDLQAKENAIARLKGNLGKDGIPGVGLGADLRANFMGLGKISERLLLSDEERVNRNDWNQLKLQYTHDITGAGGPPQEKADIQKALEGAKSGAEQKAALEKAQGYIDRYKATARGTYGGDAEAEFQRRMLVGTGAKPKE